MSLIQDGVNLKLSMNSFYEFCRFTTTPRFLHGEAQQVKTAFIERAETSGGQLFGCWRSMVGLGLARDEGIALSSWPSAVAIGNAPTLASEEIVSSNFHVLEASVRPVEDTPPTYDGVYVFRWFDIDASDWDTFREISNTAWPNMERVFDVNICGFWSSQEVATPNAKILLLTRYADLSVWEASRWWNKPTAKANASMSRFEKRNNIIKSTIAYPSLLIL